MNGAAGSSAYSASKFGIIGLTESLAQEVRRNNIRVTALALSTIATDLAMSSSLIPDGKAEQYMHPEDFAEYIISQLKMKSTHVHQDGQPTQHEYAKGFRDRGQP